MKCKGDECMYYPCGNWSDECDHYEVKEENQSYSVELSDDEWTYLLQCLMIVEDQGLHPRCKEHFGLYDLVIDQLNHYYDEEE